MEVMISAVAVHVVGHPWHRWWTEEHWSAAGAVWLLLWLLPMTAVLAACLRSRGGFWDDSSSPSPPSPSRPVRPERPLPRAPRVTALPVPELRPAQPLRASDAERDSAIEVLSEAMARGRLTLEEGRQRIGDACAATYRHELNALTRDVPKDCAPAARSGPMLARRWVRPMLTTGVPMIGGIGTVLLAWAAVYNLWLVIPLVVLALTMTLVAWQLRLVRRRLPPSGRRRSAFL